MGSDTATVRRALLAALALMAGASLVVHLKLHPPFHAGAGGETVASVGNAVAAAFSLLDLVAVTWLFARPRTAVYGHLLNGMLALYGAVLMAHYDLAAYLASGGGLVAALTTPSSQGLLFCGADFLLGLALYRLQIASSGGPVPPPGPPPAPRSG